MTALVSRTDDVRTPRNDRGVPPLAPPRSITFDHATVNRLLAVATRADAAPSGDDLLDMMALISIAGGKYSAEPREVAATFRAVAPKYLGSIRRDGCSCEHTDGRDDEIRAEVARENAARDARLARDLGRQAPSTGGSAVASRPGAPSISDDDSEAAVAHRMAARLAIEWARMETE